MNNKQSKPGAVMGTVYVGDMTIRYDYSGCTVVQFSTGQKVAVIPDPHDASLWVQAEALGYGRQVGQLTRDRATMHCILAAAQGTEATYLLTGQWRNQQRVDRLLCALNQARVITQPWCPTDEEALAVAHMLRHGGGCIG